MSSFLYAFIYLKSALPLIPLCLLQRHSLVFETFSFLSSFIYYLNSTLSIYHFNPLYDEMAQEKEEKRWLVNKESYKKESLTAVLIFCSLKLVTYVCLFIHLFFF